MKPNVLEQLLLYYQAALVVKTFCKCLLKLFMKITQQLCIIRQNNLKIYCTEFVFLFLLKYVLNNMISYQFKNYKSGISRNLERYQIYLNSLQHACLRGVLECLTKLSYWLIKRFN